MTEKKSGKS